MSFDMPKLPEGWSWQLLEDVCDRISVGHVGETSAFFCDEGGVPLIRSQNVRAGFLDTSDIKFVTTEFHQKSKKSSLRAGDVLIVRVGQNRGDCAVVPEGMGELNCANIVLTSPKGRYSNYLGYYFNTPYGREALLSLSSGSAQLVLNTKAIAKLPVPYPPEETAVSIGEFGRNLDDRIDLLRQTNATLESIAQALFKSWFVDFDPVHANAGTQAPSLPPEIQALFPATFTDSPQGLIPEGWEYVSLKEAVDIFDSKRIPLAGQERAKRKGQYPYYGAAALMDWVDDYIFDGVYLLLGEDGSVADSDGYPITQYVWGKIWVNNHAHVLQGRNGISTEHLMLYLKGVNITPYMTGAVQAKLSQSNMWRIEFLMPTKNISRVFAEFIAPMFEKIRDNSEQADSLAKLRDTLLPRLISGQLRLPDAEQFVAAITD